MATVTLTSKQQKITVSGTSVNTLNFNNVLKTQYGYAFITMISGTAVNFTGDNVTPTTGSLLLSASGNNVREIIEIERSVELKYLGGAGSEVFNINVMSR